MRGQNVLRLRKTGVKILRYSAPNNVYFWLQSSITFVVEFIHYIKKFKLFKLRQQLRFLEHLKIRVALPANPLKVKSSTNP